MFYDLDRTKVILKLASPLVLALLLGTAINLVDTIMVGYLPKEYSIAGQSAIGYSIIIHWAIGGFACAISVGTQAITARRFGERKIKPAGQVLTNSIFLAVVAGAAFSLLSALFIGKIFPLLTNDKQVIELGVPYCRIRLFAILAMVGTISYKSFFDGIGKTHVHLFAAAVMNMANVLLNWVLIFGVWIFPKMYVFGAGLGSFFSSYIGFIVMILWSLRKEYREGFGIYNLSNLDKGIMWNIVRLSLPSGFTTLLMMTGFILFFSIVGMLDTSVAEKARSGFNIAQMKLIYGISRLPVSEHSFAELLRSHPPVFTAATKIIIDIMSISFMTTTALGVATATLVSQNIGKRRPDESAAYAWESVKLGVTLMLVIGGIAFFYPEGYLGIFSQDSEVIEAGMEPLRLMGGAHFLLGIGMILAQALYGAGNTKYVMWVEMFLHFFCLVPLSYFLGIYIDLGLTGIWVAGAIYLFLVSAAMVWKFREGKWKEIRL